MQRALVPAAITALTTGFVLYPRQVLHAEAPPDDAIDKKPIYDDLTLADDTKSNNPDHTSRKTHSHPSYTDRLAVHVRDARLSLYDKSLSAENKINSAMSSFFHVENAFTNTIAALAPSKESGERLMPGAIYILVAAMAGSIVARNRSILLRATLPLAVGIGAGWMVLPITMKNIGDLVWVYEKKVPIISQNHIRIRNAAEKGWRETRDRSIAAGNFVDEKVKQGRSSIEEWVRKGK